MEERRSVLKSASPPGKSALVPASALLQRLHDDAPADHFTLGWLVGSLHRRAFGVILLLLAVVAVAPGISVVAGLLMMIPAFQMITGQRAHRRPSISDAAPRRSCAARRPPSEIP
jgi:hypothetical protein